ncbi:MAG: apolipoprotein N-acyltransferase [Deltaproteobacteria bacterium]|nr:apolipoprotein N-acyltransferase [Deltaproteobacteria bacterium]
MAEPAPAAAAPLSLPLPDRPASPWKAAALVLAGGLGIAACFLRFSLWPLAWVAFAPILLSLRGETSRSRAVRLGLVAGLATNVPAFAWLVETIHLFGGFPLWLSTLFYLSLSLYSAMQFVLFALAVQRTGPGPAAIYPALYWVSLEFFYPNLFPWRLANSQLEVPTLLQVGDLTGPFGLSLLMVWGSGVLARGIAHGARAAAVALLLWLAALGAVLGYGSWRLPRIEAAMEAAPPVRLGLVQGNLSIEEKGDVRYLEGNLDTYRRLSEALAPAPDVVIWPESVITEALPRDLAQLSPAGREILGLRRPLFAGALTFARDDAGEPRFFNSVLLFDAEGRVLGMSDKQILMPFGEYMPLASLLPWLKRASPQTGDFQAGSRVIPLDVPGVGRFAPLNCYEDLRASIARRAIRDGDAEVLLAVANDAWFGDTMAPYQHEALALWRAVENRRFLVRVTNTGVTDVIEPTGRVRRRLAVFEPAAAVEKVSRLRVSSPYTQLGDWFAWWVTATAVAVLLTSAGRRGRSERPSRPRRRA